ncbi:hypothetical protein GOEFS_092_00370 [Gordonia effusa NBRC 100432]|uniref:DUF1697 domain-containing protein n=1 Tax=Gordonia effusa NBRC 100432 TaxID=1077974 RepID=H0R3G1_9ACTN|nr:DUF1697 domain-containing protein [Gordonia effusa]GAB19612.1 hypothetical protein GOEFS_092_00370 [Gordonia effusa NBRC 100432]
MSERIALIRAVNVGGAKLPMAQLREIASELGASEVSTYIASGNLLYTPPGDFDDFDRKLEKAIETQFGYFREVISRTPTQLSQALTAHPFKVIEAKFSYLYALAGTPEAKAVKEFEAREFPTEVVRVIGDNLHIRYADGAGQSKLTASVIARGLGVQGTGRNLNTVAKLIELAE